MNSTLEPSTQLLAVPGGHLAYDVRGSGPLVVCVPGLGDMRQQHRFLAPRLVEAGFRVATLDVRGHGESSTGWPSYGAEAVGADILALVEHLGGPAVVVGNSMAAASTVWAAAERPQHVAGMVLVGPFVRDLPMKAWQRLALRVMLGGPWKVAAWSSYYRSLYPLAPPEDLGEYRQRLASNLRQPGRFEALRVMVEASKAACEARLGEVRASALVVMGGADPDFPNPQAEATWVGQQLRGEVVMVEGAGHYPHVERPEVVASAVVTFCHGLGHGAPRA